MFGELTPVETLATFELEAKAVSLKDLIERGIALALKREAEGRTDTIAMNAAIRAEERLNEVNAELRRREVMT